jgi:DNA-binding CsgD family transcriptional regulator
MTDQLELPLPRASPSDTLVINARCVLRREGEQRVVVVSGLAVHHYSADDAVAEAYAMVFLADGGYATQREIGRAFKRSSRTVRRHQQRYADSGMAALAIRSGWRRGRRRIPSKRVRSIESLRAQGLSNCAIARRLGVTEKAIRKQVGPTRVEPAEQTTLRLSPAEGPASSAGSLSPLAPAESSTGRTRGDDAAAERHRPPSGQTGAARTDEGEASISLDADPTNRMWDRLLACFGYLDDAPPLFGDSTGTPGGGVLFALPPLVGSGIFDLARKLYGEIGPAFYGLRTTLTVLLFMALWRVKRPEALKEQQPAQLGRILGLDRAPEVKTLRRKLTRLASYQRAEQLGAELARRRVAQRGELMGFLYIDGHVRAYHGQRKIPKAHVTRIRLAMPATTDYWVNDRSGDPLFVVTAPANAGLTKMLPPILRQVRELVGKRRVTVVFDRGGWSPKLFRLLLQEKFDILTYRKGKTRRISPARFVLRRARLDGRRVAYRLHDQWVRFLNGKLRLRQVTRLSEDGHQTPVLTSRRDLRAVVVACRMFERWRQENFLKYLREEFLLDALVDYQVEPDDPTRTVPNPQRRKLDKEIRAARAEVAKAEQAYGAAAADNPEGRRPTMRGFKIAHGTIGKTLRDARQRLARLVALRRGVPQRVEVRDVSEGAVVKLATERKHLTNLIKMVAYQAESDLLALLQPTCARVEQEGRTFLHELLRTPADIAVVGTDLQVTLWPMSSPHRTLAARAMCQPLNDAARLFPGSRLRLRFAVHDPPRVGLAFPGPRHAAARHAPSPEVDISDKG